MKLIKSNADKMEELYRLYEQKIYHLAYGVLHDEGLAEDVVGDTMMKLVPYLHGIKKADDPKSKALVMRIARTTAIDGYRALHKENRIPEENLEDFAGESGHKTEECIEALDARRLIAQCLPDMPEILKEYMYLKYYYQFENREIAQILQVSTDVVRKRDERLRKYIKERVGGEYEI